MNIKQVIGVVSAIVGLAGVTYAEVKKIEKKRQNSEDDDTEKVKDTLKVSKDEAKVLQKKSKDEFVEALFKSLHESNSFDKDMLNTEGSLDSDKVVHIINESGYLSILMEIPDYTEDSKGPKIGDYIGSFNKNFKDLGEKYGINFKKELIAYMAVEFLNEDGKKVTEIHKINENIYSHYADEQRDGLTAFYEEYLRNGLDDESKSNIKEYLHENVKGTEMKLTNIVLTFKFSTKVKEDFLDTKGITLSEAINIISDLASDDESYGYIHRRDEDLKYVGHFLFHKNNLVNCYDIKENGDVYTFTIFF